MNINQTKTNQTNQTNQTKTNQTKTNRKTKKRSKLIGEGSYGCVYRPSIHCKKSSTHKQVKYTNKISKFMLKEDAEKELDEYKIIKSIDPTSEYFVGNPLLCSPQLKPNDDALKPCNLYQTTKDRRTMNDYSLLVLQDGGQELVLFSKYIQSLSHNSYTISIIRDFWVEALRLFKGLILFEKKGVSHHDLKPQNIVYNKSKRHAKFIDFGLTRKIETVLQLCRNDKNRMSDYAFWTYPFEFPFLNREAFMHIARLSFQEKQAYYDDIVADLKRKQQKNDVYSLKFSISFKLYFDYITRNYNDEDTSNIISKYLEDFKNTILYEIVPENYISFLNKSVRTIDGFGFAMSMQYVLCYCRPFMHEYIYDDLEECFYNMMTPSVLNRYTLSDGFSKMQEILKENDWIKTNMKLKKNDRIQIKSMVHHTDLSIDRKTHDKYLQIQEKMGQRALNPTLRTKTKTTIQTPKNNI